MRTSFGMACAALGLGLTTANLSAQSCPLKEGTLGYPVVASSPDSLDPSFLAAVADAAAYRWRVPINPRESPLSRSMKTRLRTPEPLWEDDWKPKAKHRARMTVVMGRNGSVTRSEALVASGDRMFDRSLASILDEPMPDAPPFPRLPESYAADSAMITLSFGDEQAASVAGVGVRRFAAQQRAPRFNSSAARRPLFSLSRTRGEPYRSATVTFDVDEEGGVVSGSIEMLEATDPELAQDVELYVFRSLFYPGEANCRPIAQTVVWWFKN